MRAIRLRPSTQVSDDTDTERPTCHGAQHAALSAWPSATPLRLRRGSLTRAGGTAGRPRSENQGLVVSDVVQLAEHERPAGRPFTNPDLIADDRAILHRLIGDLHATSGTTAEFPRVGGGFDRLITTDAGRAYGDGSMSIVGFFGERRKDGSPVVAEQVETVNAAMVAGFDGFPLLLGYVSRMLDDGFNYANLVVLRGGDGISLWRELPEHVSAVMDLAPHFYTSVRIYNGTLVQGLGLADLLELTVVKYWDYTGAEEWHAVRMLHTAD